MLRILALLTVLLGMVLISGPSRPSSYAAGASGREEGVIRFRTPVRVLGVVLQGEYLFVHDDEKMAKGEDCTAIYKLDSGKRGQPVVTFHCVPVVRDKVTSFRVRTTLVSTEPLLYELQEYQFAGSTEAHQVPSKGEAQAKANLVGSH
jgi:hypothetical protein